MKIDVFLANGAFNTVDPFTLYSDEKLEIDQTNQVDRNLVTVSSNHSVYVLH